LITHEEQLKLRRAIEQRDLADIAENDPARYRKMREADDRGDPGGFDARRNAADRWSDDFIDLERELEHPEGGRLGVQGIMKKVAANLCERRKVAGEISEAEYEQALARIYPEPDVVVDEQPEPEPQEPTPDMAPPPGYESTEAYIEARRREDEEARPARPGIGFAAIGGEKL
jgi:hypothetical protein